MNNFHFMRIVE